MSERIPLGEPETERREFKGRDALRHLPNVSREVVGMLNSAGGDIWVGLAEDHGRAAGIETIENAAREVNRLRDHLVDAIEPSPTSREVVVEQISHRDMTHVLKIHVNPTPGRGPYALREGTARHFIKRVHDRLRPMSREEIFHLTGHLDKAHGIALRKMASAREQQQNKKVFWLRIQPIGEAELRLAKDYREYFVNPLKTGNRISGWNFVDPYGHFEARPDLVRKGRKGETCVEIFRDGAVQLTMPTINLYWKTTGWLGDAQPNEIWPYTLLEFPASIFRLASTIYREHKFDAQEALADLALFGVRGWTLRPFSPVSFGYKLAKPQPFDKDEIIAPEPLGLSLTEVEEAPDRCAFRLVRRIYEAFGLFEEEMPTEFDRDSGRLILPGA